VGVTVTKIAGINIHVHINITTYSVTYAPDLSHKVYFSCLQSFSKTSYKFLLYFSNPNIPRLILAEGKSDRTIDAILSIKPALF
jgi:hypothetical protein